MAMAMSFGDSSIEGWGDSVLGLRASCARCGAHTCGGHRGCMRLGRNAVLEQSPDNIRQQTQKSTQRERERRACADHTLYHRLVTGVHGPPAPRVSRRKNAERAGGRARRDRGGAAQCAWAPTAATGRKNSADRAATVPLRGASASAGPVRRRPAAPANATREPDRRGKPARAIAPSDRSPLTSRSEGKGIAARSLAPGTSFRYFIVIVQLWPLIGRARDAVGMH